MLLKAEFEANMSFLEPSIEAMLTAGEGNHQIKMLLTKLINSQVVNSSDKCQDTLLLVLLKIQYVYIKHTISIFIQIYSIIMVWDFELHFISLNCFERETSLTFGFIAL